MYRKELLLWHSITLISTEAVQQQLTKYFRYTTYVLLALLLVSVLALLLLQLPSVQTYTVNKINNSLSEKLGNKIQVGAVDINFFNNVDLNNIYIEDQAKDTLAFIQKMNVSTSLIGILKKELLIKEVDLEGAFIHIKKDVQTEDFNYQFIIDAFANTDTLNEKSSENPFTLDVDQIQLTNTHFILEDKTAGSKLDFKLANGNVDINTFDLDHNEFDLGKLSLHNAVLDYAYLPTHNETSDELTFPKLPLSLKLQDISVTDSKLALRANNGQATKDKISYSNLEFTNFQLEGQNINIDSHQITGKIKQLQAHEQSGFELTNLATTFAIDNQKIELLRFELATPNSKISNQSLLTFSSFSDLQQIEKLNLNTNFNNTSISIRDIKYFANLASEKTFNNISPTEKLILKGSIDGNVNDLNLSKITAHIPAILDIKIDGNLKNSLDINSMSFDLNVDKLSSSSSKLNTILNTDIIPRELDALGNISLVGKFKGDLSSFDVRDMTLNTSAKTSAQLSGTIKNALDPDKLLLDVNIKEIKTHLEDIKRFIKGDLPPAIQDAGAIGYTGEFKGTLTDFMLDGNLTTDIGDAQTDVALNFNSDYTDASYDGVISLDDFDLGSILNNKDFGKVSLTANTKGSGFDFNNINNQLNAEFSSLVYKDINYQNFQFNGSVAQKVINGDFNIDNPSAKATFKGILDLSKDQPDMNFQLDVDTLQLQPMNITDEDIAFSGAAKVVGQGKSVDGFIGYFQIDNFNLSKDSLSYQSDSLVCSSVIDGESLKKIKLNSDGINADILGDFTLSQLPIYISNVVDEYIPVHWISEKNDALGIKLDDPQIFTAKVEIENEKLTRLFLPDLEEMKTLQLEARVNSETDSLIVNGNIETITYDGITTTNLTMNTAAENNKILNTFNFQNLSGIAKLQLPNTTINANLQKDSLLFYLDAQGESKGNILNLAATLSKNSDLYEVNFRDKLQLDTAQWTIASDNYIRFKENYLDVSALHISKGNQILNIESESQGISGSNPLDINVKNFNVHELSNLFALENDMIFGTANGQIVLDKIFTGIEYSGDLVIKNIIIDKNEIGNFKIDAKKRELDQIVDLDVSLNGTENDFSGNGFIDIESNTIQFDADFNKLKLVVLDPFLTDIISESKGSLGGEISIEGSLDAPIINGIINTNEVSTLIDFSQTRYDINNQTVRIDNTEISFNDFALSDVNGQLAKVNGEINHNNFKEFTYNLSIDSDSFQYLNTSAEDNPLFYGTLFLDLSGNVTGPIKLPNLDVDAKALRNSKFHLSPFIESDVISQDDYIIFTNKEINLEDTTTISLYELKNTLPLNLNLNLAIDNKTEFQFIIDPVTGDRLSCLGDASLQVGIAPSGNIEVFGVYTVDSGKYNFSYGKLLKKEFKLSQGGRVSFQGNPLLAQFDVNAIYNTKATPSALLDTNDSTLSENEIEEARQRTLVQILLNLNGSINDLDLKFDLNFPNNDFNSATAVGRRIASIKEDQEELYNQVFSLLIINSFYTTRSTSNLISPNAVTNEALKSVSGLIENRLNKLASNLIPGFEVNINIDSYNNEYLNDNVNTSVTEFGLGVSKKLFNDRLTLQALGNLDVDNSTSTTEFSGLAGDFIIEYKLNEKGNYVLSAFRKSDYNILQDENTNKNGIGVQFKKSLRLRKLKKVRNGK